MLQEDGDEGFIYFVFFLFFLGLFEELMIVKKKARENKEIKVEEKQKFC